MSNAPLTPPEVDISDWPGMMIDIARLQKSRAWLYCKTKAHLNLAFHLLNLWMAAWHEVPAGSLEDDDDLLSDIAKCRDVEHWQAIKDEVLRGFVLCDDGRWYHDVIAAKALECWLQKLGSRISSGHGNAARYKGSFDDAHLRAQVESARAALMALDPNSSYFTKRSGAVSTKPVKAKTPRKPPKLTPPTSGGIPSGDVPDGDGIATEGKGREGKGSEEVGGKPPTTPAADAPVGEGEQEQGGELQAPAAEDKPPIKTRGTPASQIPMADKALVLSDWLAPFASQWAAFEEIRWKKNGKAPYTLEAQRGILRKLKQFHDEGQDIGEVLDASTTNGWTGVFAQRLQPRSQPAATARYAGAAAGVFPRRPRPAKPQEFIDVESR